MAYRAAGGWCVTYLHPVVSSVIKLQNSRKFRLIFQNCIYTCVEYVQGTSRPSLIQSRVSVWRHWTWPLSSTWHGRRTRALTARSRLLYGQQVHQADKRRREENNEPYSEVAPWDPKRVRQSTDNNSNHPHDHTPWACIYKRWCLVIESVTRKVTTNSDQIHVPCSAVAV